MVKSLGAVLSEGWKGAPAVWSVKRFAIFAPGFWAMFNAAVDVSVGMVGLKPAEGALLKSVVQGVELGPLELTHAARILASVSISACGTVPLPAGVVGRAWPVSGFSRFAIGF